MAINFSLIIPTYNEAEVIVHTVGLLASELERKLAGDWEIIIVDNGSSDETLLRIKEKNVPNIRTVQLLEKGKGRAVRAGFSASQGYIVGFTDADLPVDPEEILRAHELLVNTSHEVIMGSRFHPKSMMPEREWWRVGSSKVFNFLSRIIVGVHHTDTQCPLKLMKRTHMETFLMTKENGWFFDIEFIALLEKFSIPIVEVPVLWNEHRYPKRHSKLSMTTDSIRAILAMFRIRQHVAKNMQKKS